MKARATAVQGALALAGLALAYTTWQRAPVQAGNDAVVLDLSRNQVEQVRYDEPSRYVEVRRAAGDLPVLVATGGKDPQAVIGAADAGTPFAHPPVPRAPDRTLHGNAESERFLSQFAPLRAKRALGKLGEDKLKELGLTTTQRKLAVKAGGTTYQFKIGQPPSGVNTGYLQNEADGQVYLLGGTLLGDLEAANSRLVDRRLHAFKQSEFDALTVRSGASQKDYVYQGTDVGQNVKVAPKETPDKPDDFAKNWHDKVWRLFPIELLGRDEKPAAGEPQVALRVEYGARGKQVGFFELGKTPQGETYARTENTAGWVKVQGAEDVVTEAAKVAGGG